MINRLPLLFACFALPMWAAGAEIDTALGVRSLTAEQAKQGVPVKLRATVGFIDAPATVFVQDMTAGTFFRTKQPLGSLREGDVVEVRGRSYTGLYVSGVELESLQVLGHGDPPEPRPATYDDLASGRFHYLRVKVEGIVRSVVPQEENRAVLRLAVGSRVLEVRVDRPPPADGSLIDAGVTVQGLAAGTINELRQLVQPYVRVSTWQDIVVTSPASPADQAPQISAGSLLRFSTAGLSGHRVRVHGTVLAAFADGHVFLRDEDSPLALHLAAPQALMPGDVTEVLGFPEMGRFSAVLEDALVENHEPGPASPAAEVTLKQIQKGGHDGDLVTLAGTVTDVFRTVDGQVMLLDVDGRRVRCQLTGGELRAVATGSHVRATGICRVESVTGKGYNSRPDAVSLWLRSSEDVRVLSSPSWWTAERLLSALGLLALVILAAAVWIVMLRRQVARQTTSLRDRIQREAALEERQRIAREFHDTLEQELAGLSLRMGAAATRPLEDKARGLLEASCNLVARIQAEARNLVADLRDDASVADLATSLRTLEQRHPADGPVLKLEMEGEGPALPSHVAHHLRMIAQEAVTNALKHARAALITIRLEALAGGVRLMVCDDGAGFDPQAETQGKAGHFGCMGIRERCQKAGAQVQWQSAPGKGTALIVDWTPAASAP